MAGKTETQVTELLIVRPGHLPRGGFNLPEGSTAQRDRSPQDRGDTNVVPLARRYSGAPAASAAQVKRVDGESRPAPPELVPKQPVRLAGVILLSVMLHGALFAVFWQRPRPLASKGTYTINVELVEGAVTLTDFARTQRANEVASVAAAVPELKADRQPMQQLQPHTQAPQRVQVAAAEPAPEASNTKPGRAVADGQASAAAEVEDTEPAAADKTAKSLAADKATAAVTAEGPARPAAAERPARPVAVERTARPVAADRKSEAVAPDATASPAAAERNITPIAEQRIPSVAEQKVQSFAARQQVSPAAGEQRVSTAAAVNNSSAVAERMIASAAPDLKARPADRDDTKPSASEQQARPAAQVVARAQARRSESPPVAASQRVPALRLRQQTPSATAETSATAALPLPALGKPAAAVVAMAPPVDTNRPAERHAPSGRPITLQAVGVARIGRLIPRIEAKPVSPENEADTVGANEARAAARPDASNPESRFDEAAVTKPGMVEARPERDLMQVPPLVLKRRQIVARPVPGTSETRPPSAGAASTATSGTNGGRPDFDVQYSMVISRHLAIHGRSRGEAGRLGGERTATVLFRLDGYGYVTSISLLRSSGSASLDYQAQTMVLRASPFPAPPERNPMIVTARVALPAR